MIEEKHLTKKDLPHVVKIHYLGVVPQRLRFYTDNIPE
jgi:hypothetical protein